MKTTTLRNKIMAGVLCATLVGGVGTAFAATDAGDKLQAWYDGEFKTSAAQVMKDTETYGKGLIAGLQTWFGGVTTDSTGRINAAGLKEISDRSKTINAEAKAYINDINGQKTTISQGMQEQYNTTVNTHNGTIDGYATWGYNYAEGELTKALNKQGGESVTAVTDGVAATQKQAIADLTAAIDKAKSDLQVLIDAKEAAATTKVKAHLDEQIRLKKADINAKTAELEGLKKADITKAGQDAQDAATKALEDLVIDFNNVKTPVTP